MLCGQVFNIHLIKLLFVFKQKTITLSRVASPVTFKTIGNKTIYSQQTCRKEPDQQMDHKHSTPNYRSLLAPSLKKETHSEHQKDPHSVTYDAIRERATSEPASPPDSTKPNRTTEQKKKQTDVKFQDITWKRKSTKRPSQ